MSKKKWAPKILFKDPATLIPYVKNSKIHSKSQITKIAGAISEFGFTQPIVLDKEGVIIAGHGRREAAIALNLKEVPVVIADHLTEDQIIAARIADNKIGEAPWDQDVLKFELGTLKMHDYKMELTGFEPLQIEEFLLSGEIKPEYFNNINQTEKSEPPSEVKVIEPKNEAEDEIPDKVAARAKLGDIYQLGAHRLMCGDSTVVACVEMLLNGEKADMIFTDPPYNQSKSTGGMSNDRPGWAEHKDDYLNDFEPAEIFPIFECSGAQSGYFFCNKKLLTTYLQWAETVGGWDLIAMGKNNPIPLKGNKFLSDIEWLIFARKKGAHFDDSLGYDHYRHVRMVSCKEREFGHPTEKQVGFIEPYLQISAPTGGIVLDLFGGSGTTLIAAEKTGRKCFMMELDPHYVDVIISRWEAYTGKKATIL